MLKGFLIFLLFGLFLFYSCKSFVECNSCNINYTDYSINTYTLASKTSELDISHVRRKLSHTGIFANGGFHFVKHDNEIYFTYFRGKVDTLYFLNLNDSTKYRSSAIPLGIKQPGSSFSVMIQNDTIHLIDIYNAYYYQVKIGQDFELNLIRSLGLGKIANLKNVYFNSNIQIDKQIAYSHPYLVLPYGRYDKKNGADKNAWYLINMNNQKVTKGMIYPERLRRCDVIRPLSIITKLSDSIIITTFTKSDNVYLYNVQKNELKLKSDSIHFKSNYMCYDKEKSENLAYTNNYENSDESNINLIQHNDRIFLIKRLRKAHYRDTSITAVLTFDLALKHTNTYLIPTAVQERFSYQHQNGITFISSDFRKAIHYEFSND